MRALKSFLILVFLTGVMVHVFSANLYVRHVGEMLIGVAVLSRVLLYARGLIPSGFLPPIETSALSLFDDGSRTLIAAYNEKHRTPIERVISDE